MASTRDSRDLVWHERLVGVRGQFLASLPTQPDGSAKLSVLAQRAALRQALPCLVTTYRGPAGDFARLDLGRPFAVRRGRLTRAARSFGEEMTSGVVSRLDPGPCLWLAATPSSMELPLAFHLERPLLALARAEEVRRERALQSALDAIGWRPLHLPSPDGAPDPRTAIVGRNDQWNTGIHRLGPEDLVEDMAGMRSVAVVPEIVETTLRVARLLYLRGWNHWEFFTAASREAAFALEVSLAHLLHAAGSRQTPSLNDLLDRAAGTSSPALLSQWERRQGHHLRSLRNSLVHVHSIRPVQWISEARRTIEMAVRLINLTWARSVADVPIEYAWEPPQQSTEPVGSLSQL